MQSGERCAAIVGATQRSNDPALSPPATDVAPVVSPAKYDMTRAGCCGFTRAAAPVVADVRVKPGDTLVGVPLDDREAELSPVVVRPLAPTHQISSAFAATHARVRYARARRGGTHEALRPRSGNQAKISTAVPPCVAADEAYENWLVFLAVEADHLADASVGDANVVVAFDSCGGGKRGCPTSGFTIASFCWPRTG